MKHIIHIIDMLKATSSRNEKEEILRNNVTDEWLDFLYLTYNPFINYHITDISDERLNSVGETIEHNYNMFASEMDAIMSLLDDLSERKLTGNKALATIKNYKNDILTDDGFTILKTIISRSIDAGVSIKTLNKVYNNFIPTFTVMLAEQLDISKLNPDKFYYIEEKMDGVRFEAYVTDKSCTFYTRNGNAIEIPKLGRELSYLVSAQEHPLVLSLEITGKDRKSVSGTINKFIQGTAETTDELNLMANVFDVQYAQDFEKQVCNLQLSARKVLLEDLFSDFTSKSVVPVKYVEYHGEGNLQETIMNYFKEITSNGGEGVMVKDAAGLYEFKRSNNWLKMKEWKDIDLRIKGFTKGTGKRANTIGAILCETEDGKLRVSIGTGLSDETLQYLTDHQDELVNTICTVTYNSIIQDKNSETLSLFLPVFKELRPDKDEADKC